MRDLAPTIVRQRLVVEGTVTSAITAAAIAKYLRAIGGLAQMRVLTEPVTHLSPLYGWAGWVHWETSGAHFYAGMRRICSSAWTCTPAKPSTPV